MYRACQGVFWASGFAALLYQVIWQRILAIFSGADVYSATIIVAAFMAGLGIGSFTGGQVADRVTPRTSLGLFGICELAIAMFGVLSAGLYYDVLYVRLGHVPIGSTPLAALLFGSLLWPTFFMGASLPLLARALIRQVEGAAKTIGILYGLNTLGAASGAFVATWWLLPRIGLEGSLSIAAALNGVCALIVLPCWIRAASTDLSPHIGGRLMGAATAPPRAQETDRPLPFLLWLTIYACSGFIALSLEIVWFRALGVMMKATAFTFGTLLTIYLAALGAGSLAGGFLARRIRHHASAFLALQAAAGLLATGLLAIFISLIDDIRALQGYFSSYEPVDVAESVQQLRALVGNVLSGSPPPAGLPANFLRFYVVVPILLVAPATFLMGCSFPVLQRIVQTDLTFVGRRVGLLLVANIFGSVLGSVITGAVLLDVLGTAATFRLLAAASAVFAVMAAHQAGSRTAGSDPTARYPRRFASFLGVTAVALFVANVALIPDQRTFWARLHGTGPDRIVLGEDGSGVSAVKIQQPGFEGKHVVFVNGLGQSTLPYGDIHTALGAVPAFIHPAPRTAVVIGLGSGDTVHAVAGRAEIERIDCIEIVRPQIDTLTQLGRQSPYGGLHSLLANPRIEHIFSDGRIYLMRGGRSYDIIEADALRPGSAYAGNLYSEEYFRLVRTHLAPNGLAATWAPTGRVERTFMRVFPYVVKLPGMLIGSNSRIELDTAAVRARIADANVRRYFEVAGIDIQRLLNEYLAAATLYTPADDRQTLTDVNTDLFPKDEYDLSFGR